MTRLDKVETLEPGQWPRAEAHLAEQDGVIEGLFARLDGDAGPSRREVVPTRLIVRGSGELRP